MRSLLLVVVLLGTLAACENPQFRAREKGALTGGAIGAGLGAIVGNQVGSSGAGIAIGSALGALSGGLIGNTIDAQDSEAELRQSSLDAQRERIAENKRLLDELRARGTDARVTDRGVVINFPDVLFQFGRSDLTVEADRTAREIAEVVRRTPGRRISVEGHTDSVGTYSYNQKLSEARARSVADALVADGVQRNTLHTRGFGEGQPIASNASATGRQRNRRVEVVIENR